MTKKVFNSAVQTFCTKSREYEVANTDFSSIFHKVYTCPKNKSYILLNIFLEVNQESTLLFIILKAQSKNQKSKFFKTSPVFNWIEFCKQKNYTCMLITLSCPLSQFACYQLSVLFKEFVIFCPPLQNILFLKKFFT